MKCATCRKDIHPSRRSDFCSVRCERPNHIFTCFGEKISDIKCINFTQSNYRNEYTLKATRKVGGLSHGYLESL